MIFIDSHIHPINSSAFYFSHELLREDVVFVLLVLGSGDPHVLDIGERGEDGPSFPAHGGPGGRSEDSGLDLVGKSPLELFDVALGEAFEHGVSSSQHNLVIQIHSKVDVHLGQAVGQALNDSLVN